MIHARQIFAVLVEGRTGGYLLDRIRPATAKELQP